MSAPDLVPRNLASLRAAQDKLSKLFAEVLYRGSHEFGTIGVVVELRNGEAVIVRETREIVTKVGTT